jgi:GDP-L-fucose synthase
VKEVTGFEGEIVIDTSRPDGTPRKQLDTSLINRLGWKPKMPLREGLEKTYEEFKQTQAV